MLLLGLGRGENMLGMIQTSNVRRMTVKNPDGSVAGIISVTKPGKKKTKKLHYNFKLISAQIMKAKTSANARQVMAKAKSKTALLRRQLRSGEYDDEELQAAIIHAMKMERIARKKMKHLQEEEAAKKQGGACQAELDEESAQEMEGADDPGMDADDFSLDPGELKKLMKELQDTLEEIEDTEELEELTEGAEIDMDPEDLELLKKKHRAKELREITEADMKYLRAVFQKLEREGQEAVSGGVSLEIGGLDMPVPASTAAEAASAAVEGSSIDASV